MQISPKSLGHTQYFFILSTIKWNVFNKLFLEVLDEHAPIKTFKIRHKSSPAITPLYGSETRNSNLPFGLVVMVTGIS